MKQSEYIPISVMESIENKDIAKIVNYLERNTNLKISIMGFPAREFIFKNNGLRIFFSDEFFTVKCNNLIILRGKTKILADNIVGIWGNLKHL